MDNPDKTTRGSSILKILEVDIDPASATYLKPTAEYIQFLERPAHALDTSVDKIGDAIFMDNGKFLTIERDSTIDLKVYLVRKP